MAKDPAWLRAVSGVCGIGIMVAVLLLLRQRGVSGDDAQQWEMVIVIGAAAAGIAVWLVKRRQRRQP
jgi:4-amino-4-deoxy-L-arabinose transferase-like glycosyltransferase